MIVLRRWNSFSPGLFTDSTGSLGGGYLLRIKKKKYLFSFSDIKKGKGQQKLLNRLRALDHSDLAEIMEGAEYNIKGEKINIIKSNEEIATLKIEKGLCYLEWQDHELEIGVVKKEDDKINIYSENSDIENIVIDPGYNFLQNFRSEGFHVEDIDTIIVTHSHLDHCAELLPIMDLMFQINKRYESTFNGERQRKRVNLCLSQGAYKKFSSFTNEGWQNQLKDVIILEDLPKKKWIPFEGLTISAIQTPHLDLGGEKAIGLMIEIDGVEGEKGFKKMYLFCWDDVPEKDCEKLKLIDFLVQNLQRRQKDGNWVKNAEIKIDDKKPIKVIDNKNKENSIILKLNEKENNVTLIEIHGEETYELGFTLGVKKENGKLSIYKKICLGFTGDTPWYRKIREHFSGCDLLCVHLGSIKYQEIGYTDNRHNLKSEKREIAEEKKEEKFEETYTESNHLLFFGTEDIISHYDKTKEDSLIIVGEFGEELKYGLRVDLCRSFPWENLSSVFLVILDNTLLLKKMGQKRCVVIYAKSLSGKKR